MKIIKNRKGFSLVMVIIVLAILSLLGSTILSVATSEYNFTQIDSINQSAYYIAESGVNFVVNEINEKIVDFQNNPTTAEDFFEEFEAEFLVNDYIIDSFQENSGKQPVAVVKITKETVGDNFRDYEIESTGSIGSSKRIVNTIISIIWAGLNENAIIDDLLFYTKDFEFAGNSMNGINGTTVSDGIEVHDLNGGSHLTVSTMFFNGPVNMDGGSASFGSQNNPGTIYINGNLDLWNGTRNVYGDVRVNGNFRLKDANMKGNVYVDGDLILGWTPQIDKNIYYTGNLITPDNYDSSLLSKCKKVSSVEKWEVPVREIELRDNSWYISNGYEVKGNTISTAPDNAKWLVDNYKYLEWPKWDVNDGHLSNVVIVSKGDIEINTATSFSGALIAPNGIVRLTQGGTTFNGVIISKNGILFSGGGSTINLKAIQELFSEKDIPVIFSVPNNGNNDGDADSSTIELGIKQGIREN